MGKHIIRTEYLKLKGNTSFRVFTIFFLVFLPVIIFTLPTVIEDGLLGAGTYPFLPRDYKTTWYFTAYVASWFSLFILSFIVIFHITNEYSNKTVRQNIIDGYSRMDFFKSKFYMVGTIAIIATAYVFIVGLGAGLYFQTFDAAAIPNINPMAMLNPTEMMGEMSNADSAVADFGSVWTGAESVISYFVQVLAYLVLAVFIGFLLKKGAVSVIVYFSLFILEFFLRLQLNAQNMEWLSDHFPYRSFSLVLPHPEFNDIIFGLQSVDTLTTKYVIVSLVYVVVLTVITGVVFRKRDVA